MFNYPRYPKTNPYGLLDDEHFAAMKQFWDYIHTFSRGVFTKIDGRVAFVLPKDYGWGLRKAEDNIWGLWSADEKASLIWENLNKLINRYDLELDIIYDDVRFNAGEKYFKMYFWTQLSTEAVRNKVLQSQLNSFIISSAFIIFAL